MQHRKTLSFAVTLFLLALCLTLSSGTVQAKENDHENEWKVQKNTLKVEIKALQEKRKDIRKEINDDRKEDNKEKHATSTPKIHVSLKVKNNELCLKMPKKESLFSLWLPKIEQILQIVPACTTHATTTPTTGDVNAPVISSVAATNITATGATLTWNTNELSNSKIFWDTAASVSTTSSSSLANGAFVTSHSIALTSLSSNTTYHIVVASTDAQGNTRYSSQYAFSTVPVTDTSAPLIGNVLVSPIGSNTATVSWTTNESATSKLYYGTTNPINLNSSPWVSSNILTTAPSFTLSGLSATTTYYFVVESKDTSNNVATSTQFNFTTTN